MVTVMKKSRRKNILRSIRSSLNRFLSILFIVALGSGFLAGLFAASPDMYDTGDRYMDDYRLYDIDLKAPLGFDDDDLDALAGFSDAETLMPAHVRDLVLRTEDDITYTSRVYAALDEDGASPLNQFRLSEGRLPAAPDECLMQEPTRFEPGRPKPGDRLIVDDTENNPFCSDVLTIVGYVESPISYSVEKDPTSVGSGSIALHLYAPLTLCPDETYSDVYLSIR
ncbi:MAG: hypothetical protein MJ175_09270, partial [Clostridia bacterium]|nr:hypothetical protein [Clostridia bacterium]